jgi:uncharacterized protein GlcG (DUF336 family)
LPQNNGIAAQAFRFSTPTTSPAKERTPIDLNRGTAIIPGMDSDNITQLAGKLIAAVEKRVPEYAAIPEDNRNEGNCAVCIIDEAGEVFGKMFGKDKIRMRHSFRVAWTKASQVWITGLKTGEYERLVFTGQVDDKKFGIIRPDFIGWEGGQPIVVEGQIKLSIGFSGFRGTSDVEIVQKALVDVLAGK